ncbi:MAG TPA: Clp protease N-terminal domain-containing protein [Streptosporangiaceae bacterium]
MAVLDLLPAGTQPAAARGRRWLRRRSEVPTTIADEPEELSTTPAADASLDEAAKLAGHAPVGSHHLLLAALADPDTAAAKVLATLGVDLERAREALRQADVTGTSDELPEVRGRRQMLIRVSQDRLTIEAADEAIVALGRAALESLAGQPTQARQAAQGAQAGQPTEAGQPAEAGVIRGDLPVSSSLSDVWQALHDSLEDIRGRAAMARAQRERDEGEQPASGGGEAAAS